MEGNKIYNALFGKKEVNLSAENIELGLIDDLKSSNKFLKNDNKRIDDAHQEVMKQIRKANEALGVLKAVTGGVRQNIKSYNERISKIEKAAKELGIQPNSIKELMSFKDEVRKLEEFADWSDIQTKQPIG